MQLSLERGYDEVTVGQIAERAGLTRRTFFRYFRDKREVFFAGSERLPAELEELIHGVDPSLDPVSATLDALSAVGDHILGSTTTATRRQAIIAGSPELQERERSKMAAVVAALEEALIRRGTDAPTARLTAQIGTLVFKEAFERHLTGAADRTFAEEISASMRELTELLAHR